MMRASTNGRTAWPGVSAGWFLAVGLVAGVVLGMALPPVSGAVPQRPGEAAGTEQARQGAGTQQPPSTAAGQPGQGAAQQAGQEAGGQQAGQPVGTQQPVEGDETAEEDRTLLEPETFDGPVGIVINYIDPASTGDFESVMSRLLAGLEVSEDAERVAQAAGWKLFRAQETGPDDQAVYIEFVDPAVEDADYSVPQLLYETFPAEVQQLYDAWNGSFGAGRIWLSLEPVNGGEDESEP